MAFAQEVALLEHCPDLFQQLRVRELRLRSAFLGLGALPRFGSLANRIDRRAGHLPDLADHRQRVASAGRRTHSCPRFKSLFSSSPYPLFSSNSVASSIRIVSSPSLPGSVSVLVLPDLDSGSSDPAGPSPGTRAAILRSLRATLASRGSPRLDPLHVVTATLFPPSLERSTVPVEFLRDLRSLRSLQPSGTYSTPFSLDPTSICQSTVQ